MKQLRLLGLDTYESKAYDALLKQGASTAHMIAKISRVPSGKIYPVLESLESKGFVSFTAGRPKMYVAVSPEIAFENIIKKEKKRMDVLQQSARDIISSYSKMQSLKQEKPQDLVESYFGHSTAFARSITLHDQAQKYWKTVSRLTINKKHLDSCRKAIRRGVKILAITSPAETTEERVRQWRKAGVKVRFLPELPFRLSVYDDKGVIFRFSHEGSKQYVCTHIRNAKLAKGMSSFFDSLWKIAKK
jgi:sugar-specific transcriptional regulator TrmB